MTDANDGSDSEEPMAADHPLAESPHAAREPTRPNGWKPEDEVGTAADAKTEASVARGTWSYEGAPAQNSVGQDAVGCEPWCNGKANAMGVAYACKTIPECRSCGMCGKAGHSTEQDVDELAERESGGVTLRWVLFINFLIKSVVFWGVFEFTSVYTCPSADARLPANG